jgi:hypothetical protein
MWVGLTVPQNKEARFYQLLFWPAYLAFSYYASLLVSRYGWKIIVPLVLVLVVYAYSSFVFVSAEATVHPTEEVVDYAVSHGNGNIGMLSETGYAYSSVFIFREAQLDPERTRFFFRPCAFENMTSGEIRDFAEENSIEWFLVVRRGDPVVIYEGNLKNLPDNIVLEKTFGEVELYRVKGFTPSSKVPCNRVCLTGEELCPSHSSPFDVLNS